MKTIVVPLDGSPRAEAALDPALELREATGARIRLVTTRWDTGLVEPERYLQQMSERYPDVDTQLIADRPAVDAILLALEEPEAIACMATHGRGGLGQAVLGSVAEAVVRGTHRPVVLVGPSYRPGRPATEPAHIVAAWDRSALSTAAAPVVVEFAEELAAAVTVVEVVPLSWLLPPIEPEAGPPDSAPTLEELVRAAGIDVEHSVRRGDPADELVIAADVLDARFVVMATHGRTGLARLALGSVAMRVVHHCPCPVVVVRPADVH